MSRDEIKPKRKTAERLGVDKETVRLIVGLAGRYTTRQMMPILARAGVTNLKPGQISRIAEEALRG